MTRFTCSACACTAPVNNSALARVVHDEMQMPRQCLPYLAVVSKAAGAIVEMSCVGWILSATEHQKYALQIVAGVILHHDSSAVLVLHYRHLRAVEPA